MKDKRTVLVLFVIMIIGAIWFLTLVYGLLVKMSQAVGFQDGQQLFWVWIGATFIVHLFKSAISK